MSDDKEIIRGSGNVFRDLRHPDADGERLRALPAARDHRVPDQCKLTMHAARDETGVTALPAGPGSIGTVISLREDVAPRFGRLSPLGSQIMTLLADGKPWRGKHIFERVANGLKPWAIQAELDVLRHAGRINRPRFGVWIMAGMPDHLPVPSHHCEQNLLTAVWIEWCWPGCLNQSPAQPWLASWVPAGSASIKC